MGTEYHQRLGTDAERAHRMGKSVQDQDRGQRFVQPLLDPVDDVTGARPFGFQRFDITGRGRQQYRLQDRAQEGNTDGDYKVKNQ